MTRHSASAALALTVLLGACRPGGRTGGAPSPESTGIQVIPAPVSLQIMSDSLLLTDSLAIIVDADAEVQRTGEMLAAIIRPSTGFAVPVLTDDTLLPATPRVVLRLDRGRADLGDEGYELSVNHDSARVVARTAAGVFHGMQTLRQLLPPAIESHVNFGARPWAVRAVHIRDMPRFAWRGAMLDVARHFFTPDEVKQYIDILALYKFSILHLHLADDQGWRIQILSHPELVAQGALSEVGGGSGGFYSQAEFADLVRYAADRYITIVPEIDMPAHTNALLISHPHLSCGRTPQTYGGTEVGFSALCPDSAGTYALIDDIVGEIAALTPGPWYHMGGDEVEVLTPEQYTSFVDHVQDIVHRHGKRMIGWEEIRSATLDSTTLVQQWRGDTIVLHSGGRLILSPGRRMYIDMKYTASTEVGLRWAGFIDVRTVYDWDPALYNPGLPESGVVGVEAPLWAETIRNITAAEYLAMPRLPAVAEVGWTPQARRDWDSFRLRLARHAPRWNYLGINYNRSEQIPW